MDGSRHGPLEEGDRQAGDGVIGPWRAVDLPDAASLTVWATALVATILLAIAALAVALLAPGGDALWIWGLPVLLVVAVAAVAFLAGRGSAVGAGAPPVPAVASGAGASQSRGDDLVIRRDLRGRIAATSDSLAHRLGRPPGAFNGLLFADLAADFRTGAIVHPDDLATGGRGRRIDPWKMLRRRLKMITGPHRLAPLSPATGLWGDMRLETVDGSRWYSWREEAVIERGIVVGMRSLGRDITDRKAIEAALEQARDQAQAASLAKSRFLAMVSHEIRTPLNGILGMTGLLMGTQLTAEQRAYAHAVEVSGTALLTLIEDILDFSKVEAGRLDLEPKPANLMALVEELIEFLAPRAQAKGIELAAYVDPGLPETVLVDPARLRQVLTNLAANGIKFTSEGGVAVEVSKAAVPADAGAVSVLFEVRDTGIGIAPDDQKRIFDEFEQADPGPARAFGGTGLGLAIARQLVRLMDGDIALDSSPGAGASFTFTLRLPLEEGAPLAPRVAPETDAGDMVGARAALARLEASFARPRPPPPSPPADDPAARVLAGRRVMVISPALIEGPILLRRLFDAGAEVTLAAAAEVEADLASGWQPDAVLVDAAVGDALAMADRIRAISDVPIGILLSPAERPMLAEWRAAGYAVYLVKPVRGRSLIAAVQTLVGEKGFADASMPPAPERQRPGVRLDVLLCDDNEINLLLGRGLMEKLGHRVTAIDSGRKAVELVAGGQSFDIILMDLHMPGVDGAETVRRIRAALGPQPSPRRPQIIALTADTLAETRGRYEAGLFDDWLAKPLMPADLEALLARACAFADAS